MKTQNKILAGILTTSLLWISTFSFVSAATGSSSWVTKTQVQELIAKQKAGTTLTDAEKKILESKKWLQWKGHNGEKRWKWNFRWPELQLTESEKIALESMTDTQKQAFFDNKRTQQEAKMDAKENVIDKVLNGETLNDAEKLILEDIKKERAARKLERQTRKAEMETIEPLLDKKRAGTTLTTDEQAKLDAFEASHSRGEKGAHRWPDGNHDMKNLN
jgi:hypothetical protein